MKRWFIGLVVWLGFASLSFAVSLTAQTWQTKSGMKVVYYPAHEVPMVALQLGFPAGSAYDGNAYGLASLTGQLIGQESGDGDATFIAERFADVGAQFQVSVDRTMTKVHLKTLSKEDAMLPAVDNLVDLLAKFTVTEKNFKRIKQQQLVGIQAGQQNSNTVAGNVFYKSLYGSHPYGHDVIGTQKTVNAIQMAQVKPFFEQHYVAKSAVLVLVGDLDKDKAKLLGEKISQALPQGVAVKAIPKAMQHKNGRLIKTSFPSSQTIIRMGQLGIDYHDPEYFPLKVGNYILGGGMLVSRLAFEVREKRGLSYGVSSQFVPMPATGPFVISLATKQAQANQAIDVTEKVTQKFLLQGPTNQELKEAKQFIIGSFPLALAGNDKIAGMMMLIHFFGLPEDFLQTYRQKVKAVNADEVRQAMTMQLHPDKMLRVEVGRS